MSNLKTKEKTAPGAKPEAAEKNRFTAPSVSPETTPQDVFNPESLFERKTLTDMGDGTRRFTTDYGKTFSTGSGGVFIIENRDGKEVEKSICGPLWVSGDIENEKGEDQRRAIKWRDRNGREHEHVFRRDEFLDPKAVLRVLLSGGLHIGQAVTAQGGSEIHNFLLQYPQAEKITGVDRLGWWDLGKCFALPGGVVIGEPPEPMLFTGDRESAPRYGEKGTLEDWRQSVGTDARNSWRLMFALCVGVTPPLMPFCKEENGGFHFYGQSSKGKSTLARALCSLWGTAEDGQDNEMGGWENTANGVEAFAASHNQFPMVLDEISRADPNKVVDLLYKLGNGRGKGRMNRNLGLAKTHAWQTMFLSTGERRTEEQAALAIRRAPVQDGALIRLVNIPAVVSDALGVFDELPEGLTVDALAGRINKAAKAEAYGTAGPAFIRGVIEEVASLGGVEAFRERLEHDRAEWKRKHCDSTDSKILRVASRFGLVAAAGELAIIRGVFPWAPGDANKAAAACFTAWLDNFQTDAKKEDEILGRLDDFVLSSADHFDKVSDTLKVEHVSGRPLYGFIIPEGGEHAAYFIPSEFGRWFCEPLGMNQREVCSVLLKRERLKANDKRRGVLKAKSGERVHRLVPLGRAVVVLGIPFPQA